MAPSKKKIEFTGIAEKGTWWTTMVFIVFSLFVVVFIMYHVLKGLSSEKVIFFK